VLPHAGGMLWLEEMGFQKEEEVMTLPAEANLGPVEEAARVLRQHAAAVPPIAPALVSTSTAILPTSQASRDSDVSSFFRSCGAPQAEFTKVFEHYTKVRASNGKAIFIFGEKGVSRDQLAHAQRVMQSILTSVPGSRWGSDKRALSNAVAESHGCLVCFKDERSAEKRGRSLRCGSMQMQDLNGDEIVPPGSEAHIAGRRDASWEEITHLVHDTGIREVLPRMQEELDKACRLAMADGKYWPNEDLEDAKTVCAEYLAIGFESFFSHWVHSMMPGDREYAYNNRTDMEAGDPLLCEIIRGFYLMDSGTQPFKCAPEPPLGTRLSALPPPDVPTTTTEAQLPFGWIPTPALACARTLQQEGLLSSAAYERILQAEVGSGVGGTDDSDDRDNRKRCGMDDKDPVRSNYYCRYRVSC
jgi:hypothetical protein